MFFFASSLAPLLQRNISMGECKKGKGDWREKKQFNSALKNMFFFLQFKVFDGSQLQNALVCMIRFFPLSLLSLGRSLTRSLPCVSVLLTAIFTVFFSSSNDTINIAPYKWDSIHSEHSNTSIFQRMISYYFYARANVNNTVSNIKMIRANCDEQKAKNSKQAIMKSSAFVGNL